MYVFFGCCLWWVNAQDPITHIQFQLKVCANVESHDAFSFLSHTPFLMSNIRSALWEFLYQIILIFSDLSSLIILFLLDVLTLYASILEERNQTRNWSENFCSSDKCKNQLFITRNASCSFISTKILSWFLLKLKIGLMLSKAI